MPGAQPDASPETLIALLRAINVGGKAALRMEALRAMFSGLGFGHVQTVLQTGNVIFTTPAGAADRARLTAQIENTIAAAHGFRPDVLLRTSAAMDTIASTLPFAPDQMADSAHVLALFLSAPVSEAAVAALRQASTGPELIAGQGTELFLYYPAGIGRSKLTTAWIEGRLRVRATARNWNTIRQIAALARATADRATADRAGA